MIKCSKCKKEIKPGNQKNGLPNGIGFQMADGTMINICGKCIMKLGEMDKEEQDKFFDDLK